MHFPTTKKVSGREPPVPGSHRGSCRTRSPATIGHRSSPLRHPPPGKRLDRERGEGLPPFMTLLANARNTGMVQYKQKSSKRACVRRRAMSMYPRELGTIPEETALGDHRLVRRPKVREAMSLAVGCWNGFP